MSNSTSVIIVGAGPVGMTTALLLAKQGIASTVVEAKRTISEEGSKAVVVQRRSLEIFDEASPGLGQKLGDRGITWTTKETYRGSKLLFSQSYRLASESADQATFPPFVNVPQTETDRMLYESAVALYPNLISFVFDFAVKELRQDANSVTVTSEKGESRSAAYVVGCDGGRGVTRKLAGIDMPYNASRNFFMITDVEDTKGLFPFGDNKRRFYYGPPSDPQGQLLVMPQPDGVWRLDWQVEKRVDMDEEQKSGRLDARIRSALGSDDIPYKIRWASVYRFHNSVAARFREGRVLIAGDAAHLLSPFGGRGMNSGVADAHALAIRLGKVLQGNAEASLLDEYAQERRNAALANVAATSKALRVMEPPTVFHRVFRQLALLTAPKLTWSQRYVDNGPYTPDRLVKVTNES